MKLFLSLAIFTLSVLNVEGCTCVPSGCTLDANSVCIEQQNGEPIDNLVCTDCHCTCNNSSPNGYCHSNTNAYGIGIDVNGATYPNGGANRNDESNLLLCQSLEGYAGGGCTNAVYGCNECSDDSDCPGEVCDLDGGGANLSRCVPPPTCQELKDAFNALTCTRNQNTGLFEGGIATACNDAMIAISGTCTGEQCV